MSAFNWSLNHEPLPQRDPPPHVIIIGAGMGGLVAGRLLQASGFGVTIVEARERIGGRLYTHDGLGVPVDLGASWIHGADHNPLSLWMERAGIETIHAPKGGRGFYVNGKVERFGKVARRGWWGLSRAVTAASLATLRRRRTGAPVSVADVMQPIIDDESLPLHDRNLLAWVVSLSEGVQGAPAEMINLDDWYPAEATGINKLPRGGYRALLRTMVDGLDIRLGMPVQSVTWGGAETRVECANGEVFVGNAALVTVPLGVLKQDAIRFDPPLPAPKRAAIQRIGFGGEAVMNKVILRFEKSFWPDVNERLIVLPKHPDERGRFTNWINLGPVVDAPVIAGFSNGRQAVWQDHCDDDEAIIAAALENLGRLANVPAPRPVGALVTHWLNDPWARGSYSYSNLHSSDEDRRDYARPLGERVYFAGEGTQVEEYGTVQAAMQSGVDAAADIYRATYRREANLNNLPWV